MTTIAGIRLVAAHEFRIRLRAGRWRWLLASWVVVLLAVTTLIVTASGGALRGFEADGLTQVPLGPTAFGLLMLFVLSLALLVVPALAAQSINGDRDRGTLATVQVTLLTPLQITLGKFLAAWATALVFVALSMPMVVWTVALGGVGIAATLAVLGVVALLLGVVAALSLALSAVLVRTTMSGVAAYLVVFTLTVGTLIAFGLVSIVATETRQATYEQPVWDDLDADAYDDQGNLVAPDRYVTQTYDQTVVRTDRTWWLLAPNPFVVLADSAPPLPTLIDRRTGQEVQAVDPLSGIRVLVRQARQGPSDGSTAYSEDAGQRLPAVWPWGLAADVVLAAGALWLTARRLRTPARALPRGSRVA